MSSEYDEDDELAQWAGGYFNGDGSLRTKVQKDKDMKVGYILLPGVRVNASLPEVSGLFDAEGRLRVNPVKDTGCNLGYTFLPSAGIQMTTKHDIQRYASWLEDNEINYGYHIQKLDNENAENGIAIETTGGESVEELVTALLPYLSKSKAIQAYIIKKEILPRYKNQLHLEKRGFIECMSWIDLMRSYKGARSTDTKYTVDYFKREWPDVQPRDSHMAPSKEEFEAQLFGDQERETFEDKTGPGPRSPSDDYDPDDDPFDF